MSRKTSLLWACIAGLIVIMSACVAQAQPKPERAKPSAAGKAEKTAEPAPGNRPPNASEHLSLEEQQVAERFKHLEEVLLRMAELTGPSDPRRAALLKKAVAQSKDQLIGVQFEQLVKLLEKDQLSRAIDNQGELGKDLKSLLELLLSENRAKRLESEKARVAQYLKRLNQVIKEQKSIQARSGGAGEPKQLSGEQARLADKTRGLAKDIKANEEGTPGKQGPTAKPGQGKAPSPGQEPGKEPGKQPAKGEPSQGHPPGADQGKGGLPGKNQGAQGGKGQPQPKSQGQPKDQGPSPQEQAQPGEQEPNPARQQIEKAESRMRAAQKKLDEAKRHDATQEQEEAIRELERAKAALEEILRQLREEEKERMLAMLEVRFRKMLLLQREVLEGTVRVDKIPEKERTHEHEIEAGRLSSKETEIVVEADKALLLLREDGTAVAFPEAVAQMRQDMQQIVDRLAEAKVGKVTQALEEDVIAALQEMIEALKKAQKKMEEKKQQRTPKSLTAGEPSLVDGLAELKMIRAMQMRVNTRTQRYSKLIDGEQADKSDLIAALHRLGESEQKIHQITRDLELGKNR